MIACAMCLQQATEGRLTSAAGIPDHLCVKVRLDSKCGWMKKLCIWISGGGGGWLGETFSWL